MAVRDDFSAGEVLSAADLNDTFASKPTKSSGTTAPASPATGDLWYDTNTTPPTAKFYDGTSWQTFSAGAADFSNAATGTYTDTGVDYKYLRLTASGTLTITKAGFADILLVAGGGGGRNVSAANRAYAGAGGMIVASDYYLPAGAHTVTVGGGGTSASQGPVSNGSDSVLLDLTAVGGGGGLDSAAVYFGQIGGSGGGETLSWGGNKGVTNQGNAGGTGASVNAGGGAGSAASGGTAGAGLANTYTGSSVTYAEGGDSGTPTTANSGNGHGIGTAGDSGIFVIRVRTN